MNYVCFLESSQNRMSVKAIQSFCQKQKWNFLKGSAPFAVHSTKRLKKCILITVVLLIFAITLRNMFGRGVIYKKRENIRPDDAADFERLLYYVQHPKTLCYTALSLGGNKDAKGKSDGDKIVCQDSGAPLRQPCLVYSFGGNDEWSFEEEIEKFGCKVYTFDPSLEVNNHEHKPNIWFYRIGISHFSEDRFLLKEMTTWRMRTLDEIMESLGHENKVIDVLKLDIEGDEWNVLEDILNKGLFKKINHLCVEVHLHSMNWSRKLKILRRLEEEANMRLFSSRKNLVTKPRRVPGLFNRTEQLFYELAWFRDGSNS